MVDMLSIYQLEKGDANRSDKVSLRTEIRGSVVVVPSLRKQKLI
jgi:hypothetical protein